MTAGISGLVFGIGLTISGMVNPAKVIGFLDFFGNWDPSLAFVMGGGVVVTAIFFPMVMKRAKPVCETSFSIPQKKDITPELIIGSGMFGVGWGLVGLCPGPAISSLALGKTEGLVFFASMIAGVLIYRYAHLISGIFVQTASEDG